MIQPASVIPLFGLGVRPGAKVTFTRAELRAIFEIYGGKVMRGQWRDYGISFCPDTASFTVYRSASEYPLYRIEKSRSGRRGQGRYRVVAGDGRILRRGPELADVLKVFASGEGKKGPAKILALRRPGRR